LVSPVAQSQSLSIRPALPHELAIVMAIQDDAAAWLKANGIRQWTSPLPRSCWDYVERAIASREVYLACWPECGYAVGTLRLKWTDPRLWPADPEAAAYVHDLAVRRNLKGHRIGALMLEWAKEQARARGRAYLRLDCVAWNPALRQYYEHIGFTCRGEVTQGTYVAALYEFRL